MPKMLGGQSQSIVQKKFSEREYTIQDFDVHGGGHLGNPQIIYPDKYTASINITKVKKFKNYNIEGGYKGCYALVQMGNAPYNANLKFITSFYNIRDTPKYQEYSSTGTLKARDYFTRFVGINVSGNLSGGPKTGDVIVSQEVILLSPRGTKPFRGNRRWYTHTLA